MAKRKKVKRRTLSSNRGFVLSAFLIYEFIINFLGLLIYLTTGPVLLQNAFNQLYWAEVTVFIIMLAGILLVYKWRKVGVYLILLGLTISLIKNLFGVSFSTVIIHLILIGLFMGILVNKWRFFK